LLAGIVLGAVTIVLSHTRISGNGWSLSGNAALVVPFGVGPAVVASGWSAIVLRMRDHPRWLQFGVGIGLVGLVLVACSFLSLILFGPARRDAGATGSIFFGFLVYGWVLAGPLVGAIIPAPDPPRPGAPVWSIVAALILPVSLIAGCSATTAIPLG
jgi:O-antigen ligase